MKQSRQDGAPRSELPVNEPPKVLGYRVWLQSKLNKFDHAGWWLWTHPLPGGTFESPHKARVQLARAGYSEDDWDFEIYAIETRKA